MSLAWLFILISSSLFLLPSVISGTEVSDAEYVQGDLDLGSDAYLRNRRQLEESWPTQKLKDLPRIRVRCDKGYYEECMPCPVGYYKPRQARKQCARCGSDKGTPAEGATWCTKLCKAGERLLTDAPGAQRLCTPCERGTYQPFPNVNFTCIPCPENWITAGEGSQNISDCFLNCSVGRQSNVDGTDCELCPEGTFKNKVGPYSCQVCPRNKTTLEDGAFMKGQCTVMCEPGKEYNVTSGRCERCGPGTYKDEYSSRAKCRPCPENSVPNSSKAATGCITTSLQEDLLACVTTVPCPEPVCPTCTTDTACPDVKCPTCNTSTEPPPCPTKTACPDVACPPCPTTTACPEVTCPVCPITTQCPQLSCPTPPEPPACPSTTACPEITCSACPTSTACPEIKCPTSKEEPPCPTITACPDVTCPTCPTSTACPAVTCPKCTTTPPCPEVTCPMCPTPTEPPPCPVKHCPNGWSLFGDSCYRYVSKLLNWTDAEEICIIMGSYLAEVGSREEDQFLFSLFSQIGATGYGPWIGGTLVGEKWMWKNSGTQIAYTNWNPNEPNGGEIGENCLHYYLHTGMGWNDAACDKYLFPSLCEMPKDAK